VSTSEPSPQQPANASEPLLTAREWARTRLAHEAVMLQDAQQTLALDRARTSAHQREFLGSAFVEPAADMIHIGDVHQVVPQTVAVPAMPATPPVAQQKGLGTLSKAAIGAALIATGAGIVPEWSWMR
jgi:hypothetical protein